MRPIAIVFVLLAGTSIEAAASPHSGGGSSGGGGGGRLGHVSAGLATATSGGGGSRGGSSTSGTSTAGGRGGGDSTGARDWGVACADGTYRRRLYDGLCLSRCPGGTVYRAVDGACVRTTAIALVGPADAALETDAQGTPVSRQGTAHVAGYLGAQKVFESDGAVALEVAVADRWLRLSGSLTRFYERQPNRDALTLTMPSLALGVRIDDSQTTRVYLEAGAVSAMTKHDPVMDSTVTGALGGVYAEHALSSNTTLVGAARVMAMQDDVRAASVRAGVRYRHVQASFSVLDFNVGPALFGPELGIGF